MKNIFFYISHQLFNKFFICFNTSMCQVCKENTTKYIEIEEDI